MASGMYPDDIGEILTSASVQLIDGSSRKEYTVSVARAGDANEDTCVVIGSWGRIGSVNQHKVYVEGVSDSAAIIEANLLLQSKITRGYGPAHVRITPADLQSAPVNIIAATDDAVEAQPIADMLFS